MKKQAITEGLAKVMVYTSDKVSKDLPVFYNPVMKLNRDISILVLLGLNEKNLRATEIMAGSGIRALRFSKEIPRKIVKEIHANDGSAEAVSLIKKNMLLNKVSGKRVIVTKKDANMFLLESQGFEYIDIDPFGSPVPFLDSALKRISRGGILAITATDTAPLCGTYPKTCIRRYWSIPKKCGMMHELGLRILIRRVQLIGAQYDKALTPIFSFSTDHYFRVFFRNEKGKDDVDAIMKQQGMLENAGPLWLGQLWDFGLVKNMEKAAAKNRYDDALKLISIISKEANVPAAGFYDIHEVCSRIKTGIPKKDDLIEAVKSEEFLASETHFKGEGMRSTIPLEKLQKLIRGMK
jgi:tRNA (guanine26-N2/guanine27-N2)-dimethyltransferase